LVVGAETKLDAAARVVAVRAKSLKPGASAQIIAIRPDGTVEPLLWIYKYDPKFKRTYYYRSPLALPAGTRVEMSPPGAGSVAWMFQHKGIVTITGPGISEDDVILAALDAGAEDVKSHEEIIEVITPPDNKLHAVAKALEAAKIPVASAKLSYIPGNLTHVADPRVAEQVLGLIEALDDHDDVQMVHANLELAPELLAKPV